MSARFFELLDGLDPDENKRGREFELICRWFLRNAPRYRAQLREVWLWDEWPGRWGDDTGIDLVAETVGGELWAGQAPRRRAARRCDTRERPCICGVAP